MPLLPVRCLGVVGLGVLLTLLQGCATIWNHPTKGQTEFYADSSACEAQGGQATGGNDPYGIIRQRVYGNCMRGKGWTPQQ